MKRTSDSICLLCKSQKATKTNSHIVPKFIGKPILNSDEPNKAYVIDSSKPDKKPAVMQDSPKEDYILCPECEKYFEALETYIAEYYFKRILIDKYSNDFNYRENKGGVEYAVCKDINTLAFRLFIISIFWRCSIASVEPFSNFKIEEEDNLREILVRYKSSDINSIIEKSDCKSAFDFPIVLMKSKNNPDPSSNLYYPNCENKNVYQLLLNDNVFFISFVKDSQLREFQFLNNKGNNKILVSLLKEQTFNSLVKGLMEHGANKLSENAKKMGVFTKI